MNCKHVLLATLLIMVLLVSACNKDENPPPPDQLGIQEALSDYWVYQTDITAGLESRDGTMSSIVNQINGLGARSDRDAIADISALVELYASKSDESAANLQVLVDAENAIVPYGSSKGLLSSLAKGIFNKAKDTVVSSGRMVRSGWRVLSGSQSLRQVLNDPQSGIPIVSNFAEKIQKHNADRDASIRTSILENNSQDGMIPLDQLPGTTPQEKLNSYMNLSDESPLKMNTRRDVMYWDEAERTRTANTARELGETGVKTVGDAYGGGVGEWTNEVLNQHMQEGQTEQNAGTLNLSVNESGTGTPPIETGRTLVISRANMPDGDPRITVVMNAPQELEQPLPAGEYNIIAIADGFIRGVYENLQIAQTQVSNLATELLRLSENAIIIESLTVEQGSVQAGQTVNAHVSCASTIGKTLSFAWTVTGGTYTNLSQNGVDMSFKPTQDAEYNITVTVTDNAGSPSKFRSIDVTSQSGTLKLMDWSIYSENFSDSQLNPGETATLSLEIKNDSSVDMTGIHGVTGLGGITSSFTGGSQAYPANSTNTVNVPIVIPADFSAANGTILYNFNTFNQAQAPVTIQVPVEFPVEFYVEINAISSPVTDRVLSISGKVANPQLGTALMTLDNDPDQVFELNLYNGTFSQQVALSGSTEEVSHSVRVVAVSGGLTEEAVANFTSLIPVTALRATLTWDTAGTDVDFWITDPNGEKCYYANSTTASGLVLDFDDTNGYGPENITTETIIPGDYLVQVHYYSDHDSYNAIGSNCVVVIRKNEGSSEPPVNYYGFVGDTGAIWTVTTITYDSAKGWSLKPIDKHSYQDPSTLPAK